MENSISQNKSRGKTSWRNNHENFKSNKVRKTSLSIITIIFIGYKAKRWAVPKKKKLVKMRNVNSLLSYLKAEAKLQIVLEFNSQPSFKNIFSKLSCLTARVHFLAVSPLRIFGLVEV